MHPPSSTSFVRGTRTTSAISVLVFSCLLSSAWMICSAFPPSQIKRDDIATRSDERFAKLKKQLPAEGTIGYIGESGEASIPDYYLTQYALAPLVVDRSIDHAIVIGNFPTSSPERLPTGLHLIKDFGSGVLLYAGGEIR